MLEQKWFETHSFFSDYIFPTYYEKYFLHQKVRANTKSLVILFFYELLEVPSFRGPNDG